MEIRDIIIFPHTLSKIEAKHDVREHEVRQVFTNNPFCRWWEKGHFKGEDVYIALGQTDSGRYLIVFFVYKFTKDALVISAREMKRKERRQYARARPTTWKL